MVLDKAFRIKLLIFAKKNFISLVFYGTTLYFVLIPIFKFQYSKIYKIGYSKPVIIGPLSRK